MFGAGGDAAAGGEGSLLLLVLLAVAGTEVRADRYADIDYSGVKVPDYEYEAVGKAASAHEDYHEPLDYRKSEERHLAVSMRSSAAQEPEDDAWPPVTAPDPPPPLSPQRTRQSRRPRPRSDHESRRWERRDHYQPAHDDAQDYTSLDDTNEETPKSTYKRRRSKERRDVSEELTRALAGERSGRGRGRGRREGERTDELELPLPDEGRFPHGLDEPLLPAPVPSMAPPDQDRAPSDGAAPANRPLAAEEPSDDYGSYDVMKPVFKLKDKLPSLLRRTTPSRELAPSYAPAPPPRRVPARGGGAAARRAGAARTSRTHSRLTRYEPPTTTAADATTTTTITTTSATPAQLSVTNNNMSDLLEPHRKLSLAEKSRLSILKKSLMKDSGKEGETSKPAVLLQVTGAGAGARGLNTVVMMEPRGTLPPFSEQNRRYLLEMEETPQRLAQVKRLMRQKLLGRAKSISDLTENWDELVCDYIDTSSFVSNAAAAHAGLGNPLCTMSAIAGPWLIKSLT